MKEPEKRAAGGLTRDWALDMGHNQPTGDAHGLTPVLHVAVRHVPNRRVFVLPVRSSVRRRPHGSLGVRGQDRHRP
jgi:hypothetical protein